MISEKQTKIEWHGVVIAIQPRSKVWRYKTDNRTHSLCGYNFFLDGTAHGQTGHFSVAISPDQQQKNLFRIGDKISGTAWTKQNKFSEYADYYRIASLRVLERTASASNASPPFLSAPPDIATYEHRGARMLCMRRYHGKCFQCVWANMATVTIEYDFGKEQKHRFESFCYGPKSCKLYKMGKPRAVPYKNDGSNYDTGWLDEYCTERRGSDE